MSTMDVEGAIVLSGTKLAQKIREDLIKTVQSVKEKLPNFAPGLAIVQVGSREDSNVYIKMKIKAAKDIGIVAQHVLLPNTTTEMELISKINNLNNDPNVHGIIVQMPLDSIHTINSTMITDLVLPEKDVDGLNTINEGRVAIGDMSGFVPCTPNGCIELIKKSGIPIAGARAVVIGRSKIVGTPAAELLKWHNATVTVCHSRTKNLPAIVREADILVVGIGQSQMVKGDWIKPGAVVIDCGISAIPDPTKKSGQRLVGDVAYEEARLVASYITPVPGGVGPMTVAMLMKNTVLAAQKITEKLLERSWNMRFLDLKYVKPVPSDIDISSSQKPKPIATLAEEIGLLPSEFKCYGDTMAKISLNMLRRFENRERGALVVMTGMTPTPFGEGKSTTSLGLGQALMVKKHKNCIVTIRQPSQGPTFGIKGGAAGGGYAQVIPMEDINLHMTGDIHAVSAANNLLSAQIDARYFHEMTVSDKDLYNRLVPTVKGVRQFSKIQLRRLKKFGITKTDPEQLTEQEQRKFARLLFNGTKMTWKRVVDINDRFLRKITVGQNRTEKGLQIETSFNISVASEIMAILALSTSISDMKRRLGNIVVGLNENNEPLTADDFGATGAMAVLLKNAIEPTLMQTIEGTPVMIHTGPFANIAHGCSSIIADDIAMKLVGPEGIVVTEAGFASDIGLEKYFNIKCRASKHQPRAIVLVATVKALKMHGGGPLVTVGAPLAKEYSEENISLVKEGMPNLLKHLSNGCKYNLPVIVAINRYSTDTMAELTLIKEQALANGAFDVIICDHWANGSAGAEELANAVIKAVEERKDFKFLYELEDSIEKKMTKIAKEMYGASELVISEEIKQKIKMYTKLGYGEFPICMAKTSNSLTGDPAIKGAPTDFKMTITDLSVSVGAEFVVPRVGDIMMMPGLPVRPNIYDMDLDEETGEIKGLI